MAATHSPTPWAIHTDDEHCGYRINGANGRAIGHAIQRDPHPSLGQGITQEEAIANAQMWIAAPDLLEACEEAMGALNGAEHALPGYVVRQLERAIAKAVQS